MSEPVRDVVGIDPAAVTRWFGDVGTAARIDALVHKAREIADAAGIQSISRSTHSIFT
ncbi:hypothetical protein [Rhodococcus sp. NPDC003348]